MWGVFVTDLNDAGNTHLSTDCIGRFFPLSAEILAERIRIAGDSGLDPCFHQFMDVLQEGVWLIDENAVTTYSNRSMCEMLGLQAGEMLGRSLFEFMDEESKTVASSYFERRRAGIGERHEFRFMNKTGGSIWTILNTRPLVDTTGRFHGTLATVQDVSAQKVTEKSLHETVKSLRMFLNQMPVIAWSVDQEMIIQSSYGAGLKNLGLKNNELVGVKLIDFIAAQPKDDNASLILNAHLKAIAGEPNTVEVELAGRTLFELHEPLLDDESGKVVGCLGFAIDVTDQRKVQRELELSENQLRTILETAPDSILTVDQDGFVLTANQQASRIFDLAQDKLVGKSIAELIDKPVRGRPDSFQIPQGTWRAMTLMGSRIPVEISSGHSNSPKMSTLIVRDVSKLVELQNQIVTIAEDQQRRIGQELHDDIGQEITGASLMIKALMADMDQPGLCEDLRKSLERVSQRLERSKKLVRNLAHGLALRVVNAEDLYEHLEQLASNNSDLSAKRCHWQRPVRNLVISSNLATHLYRIAQEAVTNALKHSDATDVTISIRTAKDGQDSELRVEDNGKGIRSDSGHNGMGLKTMQYRAKVVGGQLTVESDEQAGTTVICNFRESASHEFMFRNQ